MIALTSFATLLSASLLLWKRRSGERFARPPAMLGFAAASLVSLGMVLVAIDAKASRGAVLRSRSFHGALLVVEKDSGDPEAHALELRHGGVVHGRQLIDAANRRLATTYFGPESGVGLALMHHPRRGAEARDEEDGLRVGAVGLGVGTIATYMRLGDRIRFYEVDPDVVRLAAGPAALFTYVGESEGTVEVEVGDARLSLERELREGRAQGFDVLVLDAFSGDAIPVHLLTAEAFDVYLAHLRRPDGVMAFHISNGFLDLEPVVRALAERAGLASVLVRSRGKEALSSSSGPLPSTPLPSTWVLVSGDRTVLEAPEIRARAVPESERTARPCLWTDRYSNLFRVLKG
jgi:hypothetical protein